MADGSKIEWTHATWNPVTGCTILSPGCTNCYAQRLAGTRLRDHPSRAGLTKDSKAGPVWTGEVRFNKAWLPQPLGWARPRRIFVCAAIRDGRLVLANEGGVQVGRIDGAKVRADAMAVMRERGFLAGLAS